MRVPVPYETEINFVRHRFSQCAKTMIVQHTLHNKSTVSTVESRTESIVNYGKICNKSIVSVIASAILLSFSVSATSVPFTSGGTLTESAYCSADFSDIKVYPGGQTFGIKLQTNGVLVVGVGEVNGPSGSCMPAADAGIKAGDLITAVGDDPVDSVLSLNEHISESEGKSTLITLERDGATHTVCPIPVDDGSGYKIGVWVRDSTAGIGTLTYIIPDTLAFGGLGHGIYDSDTGILMPMKRGTVSDVVLTGVKKGRAGAPGELQGFFGTNSSGTAISNTESGVYGIFSVMPDKTEKLIPLAAETEVEVGKAEIICSVEGEAKHYDARITKLDSSDDDLRNFIIEITDPELLSVTGGIVQGMSGSPVIQHGKLVGAVTHVMITDPTRGYGIFIERMIKGCDSLLAPSLAAVG